MCISPSGILFSILVLLSSAGAMRPGTGSLVAPVFVQPKASSSHKAPEGHVSLRWKYPAEAAQTPKPTFELQQSSSPTFADARTRYLGPDRACFLSGLDEGTFYYRVRVRGSGGAVGPWSNPRSVHVRYPSMRLVAALMVLGFVLLSATVLVILHGRHASRSATDPALTPGDSAAPRSNDSARDGNRGGAP